MLVRRSYSDDISLLEGYIDVLLTLSGVKLSIPLISVLAYSIKHKKLDQRVKELIAQRHKSNIQVVSNNITKLRKMKLLEGQNTVKKLIPKDLTLTIQLKLERVKEPSQDAVQERHTKTGN